MRHTKLVILLLAVFHTAFGQDYLPLTGGTLTGTLNGTVANFNSLNLGSGANNQKLFVYDDGTDASGFGQSTSEFRIFAPQNGTNHISFGNYQRSSNIFYEHMRLTIGGFLGIGTTSPAGMLDVVNGSSRFLFAPNNTGLGDILRVAGINGFNFSVNSFVPSTGNLITDLGINYAVDGGSGNSLYTLKGNKKSPIIRMNAENGSINLYGESGSGVDYRGAAFNLGVSVQSSGNVGIGTEAPGDFKLAVEGKIGARKVVVKQGAWADYVFDPSYNLPTLKEVELFIKTHRHLPDIPSAKEIEQKGLDLGDNQATLLKKIEELTLYIIEQDKKIAAHLQEMETIKKLMLEMEKLRKDVELLKTNQAVSHPH